MKLGIGETWEVTNTVLSTMAGSVEGSVDVSTSGEDWNVAHTESGSSSTRLSWQAPLRLGSGRYRAEVAFVSTAILSRTEAAPLRLEIWGREELAGELTFATPTQGFVRAEFEVVADDVETLLQLSLRGGRGKEDFFQRMSVLKLR